MMHGDLPPSSCDTRLTVVAASRATAIPARVDPVKETMSTSGCAAIAAPTVGPSPLTRLNTPGGTPAASSTSAKMIAEKGATSDGFSTIVQPVASAGKTLVAIWLIGQFHGVMKPHTPIGSLTIVVDPRGSSNLKSLSTAIAVCRCAIPVAACACCDSAAGAPISSVITAAMSA